jgi:hypothetical protein
MATEIAGLVTCSLGVRKLKPRFLLIDAIFLGFIELDHRCSKARNLNLRPICLETLSVD